LICSFICIFVFVGAYFGGGGSVRRRNTLHVVGGRQIIICHKRGLWGERIFLINIKIFIRNIRNHKIILTVKNVKIPLKMEHITLEFRVF
jgi:hypothetical protein